MNKLYLSKKCLTIPSFKIIQVGIAVLISVVHAWGQNEVSVDKFTGTAHVSIPLCAIQNRGVALSLGLHYIASGVPVDEIGASAGVNWAFTGVPAISREVRDLPDDLVLDAGATEKRYGWIMPNAVVSAKTVAVPLPSAASPCTGTESSTTIGAFQQTSTNPQIHEIFDAEPDVFSYSLPGHTGKFVFDEQRNIRLIPYDNVTITYVRGTDQALEAFEVFTPEGHKYVFDIQDATEETSVGQPNQPQFFRRRYESNKAYTTYCAAWHVSHIYAPQLANGTGNSALGLAVSFEYLPIINVLGRQHVEQLFWPGVAYPQTLYATSITSNRNLLTRISTDNQAIDLGYNTSGYGNGGGPLSILNVSSLSNGIPTVVKHIDLLYSPFSPGFYLDRPYYDQYGTALSEVTNAIAHRYFLTEVRTANDCMTFASYTFAYHNPSALPPVGCVEQDYWGYFNGNRASTLAPQLFVYPQLDPATTPGGPYRLFDIPSLTGGLTLPGADRRPPQTLEDFQATTLAGTLSSVTLPTGGTVAIEYEPQRFYDPLAQSYRNGAGVRAKVLRIKDNISGVEQVREYQYQQNNGASSGRLLHIPRFAITAPTTTTNGTPLAQWTASTAVSVTDLASDPFETRDVGYSRVIEKVAGRGKSIYTFALNALPEDAVAAGYTRTTTGLTRQLTPQCPTTGLYQSGAEVYPFPQLTNYGHERGNLQSVSHETEPNAGGTSQVVQSESFTYGYVPMPSSVNVQVHGVAYEKLLDQGNIYAYGKYSLQTGFVYALLNHSTTDADQTQSTRTLTASTRYIYNQQGQVAAVVRQNSDGTYYRTRTKYLGDFAGGTGTAGPLLTAIRQRYSSEHISNNPVEVITEIKLPGSTQARVTGISTNTFIIDNGCSRPYQQYSWRPAQPVLNNSSAYDSTRIKSVNGVDELVVNPQAQQHLISTIETVSQQLVPTDVFSPIGRKRMGMLVTDDGSSAKLRIQNGRVSEILFTDFESSTIHDFAYVGTPVTTHARTGAYGLAVSSGVVASHVLPESTSGAYQLSLWVQNQNALTATISVSIDGTLVQSKQISAGNNWQLLQFPLNLTPLAAPRSGHLLQITTDNPVYVDDALLLPQMAIASSTTYDNLFRRTSETDANGQTQYYEYDPAGNEAVVRDHNKAIIKQVTKVIAGRTPLATVDFMTNGDLFDQQPIYFAATSGCLPDAQYAWRFVDPQTGQVVLSVPTSSAASTTQTFNTGGLTKTYEVTVTITSQGRQLSRTRTITLTPGPLNLQISMCGNTSYDACTATYGFEDCGDGVPASANRVKFTVAIANAASNCSSFTYDWEIAYSASTTWTPRGNPAGNSPQLDMPADAQEFRIRCVVHTCGGRDGISPEASYRVNFRSNSPDGHLCDAVINGRASTH